MFFDRMDRMDRMDRRGAEVMASRTMLILLAVIGAIVIIAVMIALLGQDESIFGNWICRTSVYFSDQASFTDVVPFLDTTPILCKTQYKKIDEEDKDDFMEKIAESMRECWGMWGEGNLDPEGTNLFKWGQNKCFTCYHLETFENMPDVRLEEFIDYLQATEMKNSDKTYWNYFKGLRGNAIIFNFPNVDTNKEFLFKEGEFYMVTYVENIQTNWFMNMVKGGVAGAIACSFGGPSAIVCAIGGGVVGGFYEKLTSLFADDVDGIMISEFSAVKDKCGGEVE